MQAWRCASEIRASESADRRRVRGRGAQRRALAALGSRTLALRSRTLPLASRVLAPVSRALAPTCLALALAGCASKPPAPPPKPTLIAVSLRADVALNPDARGRPSPLVVRIYELKSPVAFERADFVSLFERDQATLGAEFVAREEFVMRPGESRQWDKPAGADTRVIAAVAAFRDLERARWRATVPIVPNERNAYLLKLDASSVGFAPNP